jgi:membrane protein YqaA with SNARE-associated domain
MLSKIDYLQMYLSLFYNSLLTNSIFSVDREYMAGSMKIFGYNYYWVFAISFIGAIIAGSFNYFLGLLSAKLKITNFPKILERKKIILSHCNNYSVILALLMFVEPFNKVIALFLGFIRFSYIRFLVYWIISRLIHDLIW